MRDFTLRNGLLAVLLMLMASAASAAGLGRLTVLSSLGQPLHAEIELVSVQKEELASLSVRLASADAYRQADLQYNSIVAGLRFSVEKRPNGQPYIKVTTARAVNEFVVDLLIELNWAAGRLMREYRLLLDPPGAEPAPAAPPQARAVPAPQPPAVAPTPPRPVAATAGSYGPIERGETLSKIARNVKPEGVTMEQMLVGLFRSNPEAFIKKNMNLVRSGKILRVPEKDEIAAIPQQEAMKEYRAQVADWGAYRRKLADAAGTVPEARTAASGRITAKVEDKVSGEARDVVRLSKGEPPSGAAPDAKPRAAERIRALEEELVSREKALGEAKDRIAQLEKTIKDMQRLAEIKSAGMAAAQQQAEQKPAPKPEVAAPAPKPDEVKPVAAAPEKPAVEAKKAEAPKPKPAAKAAPAPPPPETGLMDVVMENWPVAAGGGVIVLIGLWLMRRRGATGGETPAGERTAPTLMAAAPVAPASGGLAATAAPASAAAPAVVAAVTAQAAAPAQAEEIDPLEEANVYLAHGRDAQAEATLKEALAKDPAREDIQAKLLTIYAARNDRAAFTRQAGEFNKLTGGKGDNWLKVAAMGLALDPQNPLYSGAKEAAVAAEPDTAQPAPVDLDFNLDLAAPATGGTDMAAGVQKQPSGQEPKPAADQPVEALMPDFRLEVPPAGEAQAAQRSGGGETAPAAETGGLDFNIELPKIAVPESKEKGPPAEAERKDDAGLDFKVDLGDINLNLDERAKEEGAVAERDAHWYDVQAKFDLAKAYQEMGHKADARNILDEVIREGDAEQQTQAKTLLRDLN